MREIKFKFLLENGEVTESYYLKELIDSDAYINIECEYSSKIKQELQYTGLKIKNKEVYEGDIIKGRKDTVYKVVFERGCFFLYHLNLFNPDKTNLRWGLLSRLFDSDMIDIEKDCEIIGNIHETPELLN